MEFLSLESVNMADALQEAGQQGSSETDFENRDQRCFGGRVRSFEETDQDIASCY